MAGTLGAGAMALPVLFHLFRLGSMFLPMYLPLVLLAFLVPVRLSVLTALVVPLLSGFLTGMPPFFPPIAPVMAIELMILSFLVGWSHAKPWPLVPTLATILIFGRVLSFGLYWLLGTFLALPGKFLAGLSLMTGWPGVVLMLLVIPALLRYWNKGMANHSMPREAP